MVIPDQFSRRALVFSRDPNRHGHESVADFALESQSVAARFADVDQNGKTDLILLGGAGTIKVVSRQ